MTIKHFIIGLLAFSLGGLLLAQPGKGMRGAKMNPEAKKEIQTYIEKEVLPILKPERAKLDSYIGETEKNQLDQIRSEMKEMRGKFAEFRKSMMQARQNGESPSEEQISQMRAMGKQQRLLMDQAWAIADEYEIEIYEILDGIKPQAETWKTDLKAIREKYKPTDAPEGRPNRQGDMNRPKGQGRPGGRPGQMGRRSNPIGRIIQSPVHFLLWDGSSKALDQMEESSSFNAFPNPSQGSQTLTYKVKTPGKVSIELVDGNGNIVRSLANAEKEKGEYSLDVDTKGLKPGVYIYRIQTPDGTKSKKIKIE